MLQSTINNVKVCPSALEIPQSFQVDGIHRPSSMKTHLTTLFCFQQYYSLGGNHAYSLSNYLHWRQVKEMLIEKEKVVHIQPLYLCQLTQTKLTTDKLSDGWANKQVGFIVIRPQDAYNYFNTRPFTPSLLQEIDNYIARELHEHNQNLWKNLMPIN